MDRAVFWLYRLAAGTLCLLPLTAIFRVGWALGTVAYFVSGKYRRLVQHNLGIAFGREKSVPELRTLARKHFAMLGANLLSSIKLPRLSREEIERVVKMEGLETLTTGAAAGKGFVMVISHLGNWEMFAQLSPILFPCPVGTIYQALGNRFIDAEVRRDRARLGLSVFERKEGFGAAAKFMREGGAVGVLVDQHAGDAGLWCPFFARLASTSTLAATLALRTGAWLVPAAVFTDGIARWRCVIRPPIEPEGEDASAITARLNETLEAQIREQPEDWFWVHNRWKLPNPKFLLATYKRGVSENQKSIQPFRIVIRSTNWLGDAVMSIPAVRAIKRGRPDAHVTILTPAKLADLWKQVAEVDEVISIESGDTVFSVAKMLRGKFEVAILFPNSLRSALEARLAGIPRRVGFPGHRRAWLLNQVFHGKKKKKNARPAPPEHQVHHYLALAEFIGAEISPDLAIPKRATQHSIVPTKTPRGLLADSNLNTQPPRIALVPGAEYGPTKRWFPERFGEVVRAISASRDCEWVLFGVPKDAPLGEEILRDFTGPHRNLIGKTTLAELIAELRACDLLLTNDTGTMHLAAFLGVPTVSLFASTEPALTGPLGDHHRVIRHHVACSPCFLRECPLDLRCMKAIESAEVVAAIEDALC